MTDKMLTKNLESDPRAMMRSCRMRAATMREIASAIRDPATRGVLQSKAREWDRLAAVAEARIVPSLEGAAARSSRSRRPAF